MMVLVDGDLLLQQMMRVNEREHVHVVELSFIFMVYLC